MEQEEGRLVGSSREFHARSHQGSRKEVESGRRQRTARRLEKR